MSQFQRFVGIDVAKAQLYIAVRPTGDHGAVTNDETGIAARVAQLQTMAPPSLCSKRPGAISGPWSLPGSGGSACRGRQSPPSARLCQRHRPTGQDGGPRCPHLGALCRRRASDAAPGTMADGGTARPAGAAPATHRHADGGTEPPRWGVPAPAGRDPSPSYMARHTPGDPR